MRDGENKGLKKCEQNQNNVTLNRKNGWKGNTPAPLQLILIYFQNEEETVWGEGDLQEILLVSLFFFSNWEKLLTKM